jgi:membrane protein required for colicin V production
MTWLDYAVWGVLGVSVIWGAWRGLVREVVAVVGWVLAFYLANLLSPSLSNALPAAMTSPEARFITAFVGLFVASLVVATLAGLLVSRLVKRVGLGGLDRLLGSAFGAARGALIVLIFALFAGLTALPQRPLWRDSVSGGPLSQAILAAKAWLPPALAERLRYD